MQGSVVANSRLDGLNIVSTTAFPVEMLERLDVLNSLTGALYGPASPAGQFNFVAKRPTEETLRKVTLGYQSRSAFTGHVDLGGHIDDDNRFGYRVNVLNQEGEGNLDDSTLRRKLLSVALDWNIQPVRNYSWMPATMSLFKKAIRVASAMARTLNYLPHPIPKIKIWRSARPGTI